MQIDPSLFLNSSVRSFLSVHSRGDGRLAAPAAVVVAGVGEAAGEHPRAGADTWGCSSRPEAGQVGLAARTGIRGGHDTGGRALRR